MMSDTPSREIGRAGRALNFDGFRRADEEGAMCSPSSFRRGGRIGQYSLEEFDLPAFETFEDPAELGESLCMPPCKHTDSGNLWIRCGIYRDLNETQAYNISANPRQLEYFEEDEEDQGYDDQEVFDDDIDNIVIELDDSPIRTALANVPARLLRQETPEFELDPILAQEWPPPRPPTPKPWSPRDDIPDFAFRTPEREPIYERAPSPELEGAIQYNMDYITTERLRKLREAMACEIPASSTRTPKTPPRSSPPKRLPPTPSPKGLPTPKQPTPPPPIQTTLPQASCPKPTKKTAPTKSRTGEVNKAAAKPKVVKPPIKAGRGKLDISDSIPTHAGTTKLTRAARVKLQMLRDKAKAEEIAVQKASKRGKPAQQQPAKGQLKSKTAVKPGSQKAVQARSKAAAKPAPKQTAQSTVSCPRGQVARIRPPRYFGPITEEQDLARKLKETNEEIAKTIEEQKKSIRKPKKVQRELQQKLFELNQAKHDIQENLVMAKQFAEEGIREAIAYRAAEDARALKAAIAAEKAAWAPTTETEDLKQRIWANERMLEGIQNDPNRTPGRAAREDELQREIALVRTILNEHEEALKKEIQLEKTINKCQRKIARTDQTIQSMYEKMPEDKATQTKANMQIYNLYDELEVLEDEAKEKQAELNQLRAKRLTLTEETAVSYAAAEERARQEAESARQRAVTEALAMEEQRKYQYVEENAERFPPKETPYDMKWDLPYQQFVEYHESNFPKIEKAQWMKECRPETFQSGKFVGDFMERDKEVLAGLGISRTLQSQVEHLPEKIVEAGIPAERIERIAHHYRTPPRIPVYYPTDESIADISYPEYEISYDDIADDFSNDKYENIEDIEFSMEEIPFDVIQPSEFDYYRDVREFAFQPPTASEERVPADLLQYAPSPTSPTHHAFPETSFVRDFEVFSPKPQEEYDYRAPEEQSFRKLKMGYLDQYADPAAKFQAYRELVSGQAPICPRQITLQRISPPRPPTPKQRTPPPIKQLTPPPLKQPSPPAQKKGPAKATAKPKAKVVQPPMRAGRGSVPGGQLDISDSIPMYVGKTKLTRATRAKMQLERDKRKAEEIKLQKAEKEAARRGKPLPKQVSQEKPKLKTIKSLKETVAETRAALHYGPITEEQYFIGRLQAINDDIARTIELLSKPYVSNKKKASLAKKLDDLRNMKLQTENQIVSAKEAIEAAEALQAAEALRATQAARALAEEKAMREVELRRQEAAAEEEAEERARRQAATQAAGAATTDKHRKFMFYQENQHIFPQDMTDYDMKWELPFNQWVQYHKKNFEKRQWTQECRPETYQAGKFVLEFMEKDRDVLASLGLSPTPETEPQTIEADVGPRSLDLNESLRRRLQQQYRTPPRIPLDQLPDESFGDVSLPYYDFSDGDIGDISQIPLDEESFKLLPQFQGEPVDEGIFLSADEGEDYETEYEVEDMEPEQVSPISPPLTPQMASLTRQPSPPKRPWTPRDDIADFTYTTPPREVYEPQEPLQLEDIPIFKADYLHKFTDPIAKLQAYKGLVSGQIPVSSTWTPPPRPESPLRLPSPRPRSPSPPPSTPKQLSPKLPLPKQLTPPPKKPTPPPPPVPTGKKTAAVKTRAKAVGKPKAVQPSKGSGWSAGPGGKLDISGSIPTHVGKTKLTRAARAKLQIQRDKERAGELAKQKARTQQQVAKEKSKPKAPAKLVQQQVAPALPKVQAARTQPPRYFGPITAEQDLDRRLKGLIEEIARTLEEQKKSIRKPKKVQRELQQKLDELNQAKHDVQEALVIAKQFAEEGVREAAAYRAAQDAALARLYQPETEAKYYRRKVSEGQRAMAEVIDSTALRPRAKIFLEEQHKRKIGRDQTTLEIVKKERAVQNEIRNTCKRIERIDETIKNINDQMPQDREAQGRAKNEIYKLYEEAEALQEQKEHKKVELEALNARKQAISETVSPERRFIPDEELDDRYRSDIRTKLEQMVANMNRAEMDYVSDIFLQQPCGKRKEFIQFISQQILEEMRPKHPTTRAEEDEQAQYVEMRITQLVDSLLEYRQPVEGAEQPIDDEMAEFLAFEEEDAGLKDIDEHNKYKYYEENKYIFPDDAQYDMKWELPYEQWKKYHENNYEKRQWALQCRPENFEAGKFMGDFLEKEREVVTDLGLIMPPPAAQVFPADERVTEITQRFWGTPPPIPIDQYPDEYIEDWGSPVNESILVDLEDDGWPSISIGEGEGLEDLEISLEDDQIAPVQIVSPTATDYYRDVREFTFQPPLATAERVPADLLQYAPSPTSPTHHASAETSFARDFEVFSPQPQEEYDYRAPEEHSFRKLKMGYLDQYADPAAKFQAYRELVSGQAPVCPRQITSQRISPPRPPTPKQRTPLPIKQPTPPPLMQPSPPAQTKGPAKATAKPKAKVVQPLMRAGRGSVPGGQLDISDSIPMYVGKTKLTRATRAKMQLERDKKKVEEIKRQKAEQEAARRGKPLPKQVLQEKKKLKTTKRLKEHVADAKAPLQYGPIPEEQYLIEKLKGINEELKKNLDFQSKTYISKKKQATLSTQFTKLNEMKKQIEEQLEEAKAQAAAFARPILRFEPLQIGKQEEEIKKTYKNNQKMDSLNALRAKIQAHVEAHKQAELQAQRLQIKIKKKGIDFKISEEMDPALETALKENLKEEIAALRALIAAAQALAQENITREAEADQRMAELQRQEVLAAAEAQAQAEEKARREAVVAQRMAAAHAAGAATSDKHQKYMFYQENQHKFPQDMTDYDMKWDLPFNQWVQYHNNNFEKRQWIQECRPETYQAGKFVRDFMEKDKEVLASLGLSPTPEIEPQTIVQDIGPRSLDLNESLRRRLQQQYRTPPRIPLDQLPDESFGDVSLPYYDVSDGDIGDISQIPLDEESFKLLPQFQGEPVDEGIFLSADEGEDYETEYEVEDMDSDLVSIAPQMTSLIREPHPLKRPWSPRDDIADFAYTTPPRAPLYVPRETPQLENIPIFKSDYLDKFKDPIAKFQAYKGLVSGQIPVSSTWTPPPRPESPLRLPSPRPRSPSPPPSTPKQLSPKLPLPKQLTPPPKKPTPPPPPVPTGKKTAAVKTRDMAVGKPKAVQPSKGSGWGAGPGGKLDISGSIPTHVGKTKLTRAARAKLQIQRDKERAGELAKQKARTQQQVAKKKSKPKAPAKLVQQQVAPALPKVQAARTRPPRYFGPITAEQDLDRRLKGLIEEIARTLEEQKKSIRKPKKVQRELQQKLDELNQAKHDVQEALVIAKQFAEEGVREAAAYRAAQDAALARLYQPETEAKYYRRKVSEGQRAMAEVIDSTALRPRAKIFLEEQHKRKIGRDQTTLEIVKKERAVQNEIRNTCKRIERIDETIKNINDQMPQDREAQGRAKNEIYKLYEEAEALQEQKEHKKVELEALNARKQAISETVAPERRFIPDEELDDRYRSDIRTKLEQMVANMNRAEMDYVSDIFLQQPCGKRKEFIQFISQQILEEMRPKHPTTRAEEDEQAQYVEMRITQLVDSLLEYRQPVEGAEQPIDDEMAEFLAFEEEDAGLKDIDEHNKYKYYEENKYIFPDDAQYDMKWELPYEQWKKYHENNYEKRQWALQCRPENFEAGKFMGDFLEKEREVVTDLGLIMPPPAAQVFPAGERVTEITQRFWGTPPPLPIDQYPDEYIEDWGSPVNESILVDLEDDGWPSISIGEGEGLEDLEISLEDDQLAPVQIVSPTATDYYRDVREFAFQPPTATAERVPADLLQYAPSPTSPAHHASAETSFARDFEVFSPQPQEEYDYRAPEEHSFRKLKMGYLDQYAEPAAKFQAYRELVSGQAPVCPRQITSQRISPPRPPTPKQRTPSPIMQPTPPPLKQPSPPAQKKGPAKATAKPKAKVVQPLMRAGRGSVPGGQLDISDSIPMYVGKTKLTRATRAKMQLERDKRKAEEIKLQKAEKEAARRGKPLPKQVSQEKPKPKTIKSLKETVAETRAALHYGPITEEQYFIGRLQAINDEIARTIELLSKPYVSNKKKASLAKKLDDLRNMKLQTENQIVSAKEAIEAAEALQAAEALRATQAAQALAEEKSMREVELRRQEAAAEAEAEERARRQAATQAAGAATTDKHRKFMFYQENQHIFPQDMTDYDMKWELPFNQWVQYHKKNFEKRQWTQECRPETYQAGKFVREFMEKDREVLASLGLSPNLEIEPQTIEADVGPRSPDLNAILTRRRLQQQYRTPPRIPLEQLPDESVGDVSLPYYDVSDGDIGETSEILLDDESFKLLPQFQGEPVDEILFLSADEEPEYGAGYEAVVTPSESEALIGPQIRLSTPQKKTWSPRDDIPEFSYVATECKPFYEPQLQPEPETIPWFKPDYLDKYTDPLEKFRVYKDIMSGRIPISSTGTPKTPKPISPPHSPLHASLRQVTPRQVASPKQPMPAPSKQPIAPSLRLPTPPPKQPTPSDPTKGRPGAPVKITTKPKPKVTQPPMRAGRGSVPASQLDISDTIPTHVGKTKLTRATRAKMQMERDKKRAEELKRQKAERDAAKRGKSLPKQAPQAKPNPKTTKSVREHIAGDRTAQQYGPITAEQDLQRRLKTVNDEILKTSDELSKSQRRPKKVQRELQQKLNELNERKQEIQEVLVMTQEFAEEGIRAAAAYRADAESGQLEMKKGKALEQEITKCSRKMARTDEIIKSIYDTMPQDKISRAKANNQIYKLYDELEAIKVEKDKKQAELEALKIRMRTVSQPEGFVHLDEADVHAEVKEKLDGMIGDLDPQEIKYLARVFLQHNSLGNLDEFIYFISQQILNDMRPAGLPTGAEQAEEQSKFIQLRIQQLVDLLLHERTPDYPESYDEPVHQDEIVDKLEVFTEYDQRGLAPLQAFDHLNMSLSQTSPYFEESAVSPETSRPVLPEPSPPRALTPVTPKSPVSQFIEYERELLQEERAKQRLKRQELDYPDTSLADVSDPAIYLASPEPETYTGFDSLSHYKPFSEQILREPARRTDYRMLFPSTGLSAIHEGSFEDEEGAYESCQREILSKDPVYGTAYDTEDSISQMPSSGMSHFAEERDYDNDQEEIPAPTWKTNYRMRLPRTDLAAIHEDEEYVYMEDKAIDELMAKEKAKSYWAAAGTTSEYLPEEEDDDEFLAYERECRLPTATLQVSTTSPTMDELIAIERAKSYWSSAPASNILPDEEEDEEFLAYEQEYYAPQAQAPAISPLKQTALRKLAQTSAVLAKPIRSGAQSAQVGQKPKTVQQLALARAQVSARTAAVPQRLVLKEPIPSVERTAKQTGQRPIDKKQLSARPQVLSAAGQVQSSSRTRTQPAPAGQVRRVTPMAQQVSTARPKVSAGRKSQPQIPGKGAKKPVSSIVTQRISPTLQQHVSPMVDSSCQRISPERLADVSVPYYDISEGESLVSDFEDYAY